ncbi:hypothetical protein TNCV_4745741 [Trichonephila clavipes]|nr:hypothetical protein TNCV_4745741 [Trichonephila clavipes]
MRDKASCACPIYVTLGTGMHVQMFRSSDQSDAKPPAFSSQASLLLIYRPTEGMKGCIDLTQRGIQTSDLCCQVICSQFGLAIHQNDHQWAQNEIAVVPDFHKRILFSDEAHFWLNGYVNKQNCRIWSEANPQVYVETPLHPEKLTVWCALWVGGILLQKR